MSELATLNPKVWFEIACIAMLAAVGWYGYNAVFDRGADSIQRKWDSVEKERADAAAKAATDALKITKDLQSNAEKERGAKDAQIRALNTANAALIVELSKRPSRDSSGNLPIDPTTGATLGATGADLTKQDAAFLLGESTRHDRFRLQLIECQRLYNSARDSLK
jgi:hypothetical protein